jgi:hypothetical protein
MNALLLYGKSGFKFNAEQIYQALQSLPGVHDLQRGTLTDAVLQGEYDFQGDSTILRLSADLQSITATGTGPASQQIILTLQKLLARPLFVTDYGYNFDLPLSGIQTVEEFSQQIAASNAEAAHA